MNPSEQSYITILPFRLGQITLAQFRASFALNTFAALPIALYIPQYIDDYFRSYSGEYRWTTDNFRPLADGLYFIINLGSPATAAAPLYLFLSLAIGSVFCVILARAFGMRSALWSAIATMPLLMQPYFLENLSYGFDSPGMTLGLGLALLAAVTSRAARRTSLFAISIGLLIAALLFYQPSASAFVPIGAALLLADWLGISTADADDRPKKKMWSSLFSLFFTYATAFGIYSILVKVLWTQRGPYGIKNSAVSGSLFSLVQSVFSNIKVQAGVLIKDWLPSPGGWIVAFSLLTCCLALAWFVGGKRTRLNASPQQTISITVLLLVFPWLFILILVASPGAIYLLERSYAGVPRTNIFFGAWLASLNLLTLSVFRSSQAQIPKLLRLSGKAAVISLAWLLVIIAYTYGQASYAQSEFEKSQITRIMGAVSELNHSKSEEHQSEGDQFKDRQSRDYFPNRLEVQVVGGMPRSPALMNGIRKFPVLHQLVPRLIKTNGHAGMLQLEWHGLAGAVQVAGLKSQKVIPVDSPDWREPCASSERVYCSREFQIEMTDNKAVIHFPGGEE